MIIFLKKNILYLIWMQVFAATAGSLFFSEVMHFAPCTLCWYQRICMYPLLVIMTVGILRKEKFLASYVLPLSLTGFLIALFHVLLQEGFLSESLAPCKTGVSCTNKYTPWFGFVTIPILSLTAFTIITVGMIIYHQLNHKRS